MVHLIYFQSHKSKKKPKALTAIKDGNFSLIHIFSEVKNYFHNFSRIIEEDNGGQRGHM